MAKPLLRTSDFPFLAFLVLLTALTVMKAPRYAFAGLCLYVTIQIAAGFILAPKATTLPPFGPPSTDCEEAWKKFDIYGIEVTPVNFPQRFCLALRLARSRFVIGWGVAAFSIFVILSAGNTPLEKSFHANPVTWILFGWCAGLQALGVSTSWYREQRFLARAMLTLGKITAATPGQKQSNTYMFRDPAGGFFGGPLDGYPGSAALVLYDPINPDVNCVPESLRFRDYELLPVGTGQAAAASGQARV